MTVYEHALVGVDGALAAGLHRRYGWQIVAWAACAAVLPDWDGLTLLLGPSWYALGHRVWGHNVLVAGILAACVSGLVWRLDPMTSARSWLARRWAAFRADDLAETAARAAPGGVAVWVTVGVAAAYSHLLADLVFSRGAGLPVWGVPLFWPFDRTDRAYPLVPWGDVGATVILASGMFAMLRWPARTRPIAFGALAAVVAYAAARGLIL